MEYLKAFLEGVVTFISPCFLPMIPIYILYFVGNEKGDDEKKKAVKNSIGFVLGFTIVFIILGILSSIFGSIISKYINPISIIFGIIIILLGVNFTGLVKFKFLNKTKKVKKKIEVKGFFSAMLFGMIFSLGWTPCIGSFLGTVLLSVSISGNILNGILILFLYSMGIGIPLIMSVILTEQLKSAFDFIKKHYKVINVISGLFLIGIGLFMILNVFI